MLTSIAYSVRHPERVTHMVLLGRTMVGWAKRGRSERGKGASRGDVVTTMRVGWARKIRLFASFTPHNLFLVAPRSRSTGSMSYNGSRLHPEDAVRNLIANGDTDVSALLAQVSVPTLVMHSRDDALLRSERRLAAGIPTARGVSLPGAATT